jgi:thymidylate synthase
MFSLIVARDNNNGIASDGKIPWDYPQDLKWFKYATTKLYKNNAVTMGYNTWKTLLKPLTGRLNIIISKNHQPTEQEQIWINEGKLEIYKSPEEFLNSHIYFKNNQNVQYHYWVIGGRQIYDWFIEHNLIYKMYITEISDDYKCDLKFTFNESSDWYKQDNVPNIFINNLSIYTKSNREEQKLLDVIKNILENGNERDERTGAGTKAIFGGQLEFNLEKFPLMTSRPHSLRYIFEELMWVLRGQRDTRILEKKKIYIWTPNSTQDFINRQTLDIPLLEGDIGESYGHNMRSFTGTHNQPYDQLENVLNLLKTNPTSRRIIICLWNPAGVRRAALPPCLCWYQFFVRNINGIQYLDCQAMNRSSDIVVAGGWNIATASLLTYILAKSTDMIPGKLSWVYGDAHIYLNNLESAYELINRVPLPFPNLFIHKQLDNLQDILKLEFDDVELINYHPIKPQIKMTMNV